MAVGKRFLVKINEKKRFLEYTGEAKTLSQKEVFCPALRYNRRVSHGREWEVDESKARPGGC